MRNCWWWRVLFLLSRSLRSDHSSRRRDIPHTSFVILLAQQLHMAASGLPGRTSFYNKLRVSFVSGVDRSARRFLSMIQLIRWRRERRVKQYSTTIGEERNKRVLREESSSLVLSKILFAAAEAHRFLKEHFRQGYGHVNIAFDQWNNISADKYRVRRRIKKLS